MSSGDPTAESVDERLPQHLREFVEGVREHRLDPDAFLETAEDVLSGVALYPPATILALGAAVADALDRSPAVAVDLTLRLMSSPARELRALAAMMLFRLARFQPGMWTDPVRHLTCDEDWEVRDLAAHAFDTIDGIEGAAGFHLEFVCGMVRDWSRHSDERVRRAATQSLLGFAAAHPEFRPQWLLMLEPLLNDDLEYVRHSAAAALRSLGRADSGLVLDFIESHIADSTPEARDVFRLVLDHPFADRVPRRKTELLARLNEFSSQS